MKKNIKDLIENLKQNNEDLEFYPTTQEMVDCIYKVLHETIYCPSILDIGAGNGNFILKYQGKFSQYSIIEKSEILKKELSKNLKEKLKTDYVFYGADFHEVTLFEKKVDVIFCNPPYSEFADWTCKIIEQAFCKMAYLVIPQRWKENEKIMQFTEKRGCTYEVIGSFDFLDAERQARAKVDIVEFNFCEKIKDKWGDNKYNVKSPFDDYLKNAFQFTETNEPKEEYNRQEELENQIEIAINPIDAYVNAYQKELQSMQEVYHKIGGMYQESPDLLKEIGVDVSIIIETLKSKIKALRISYWELFINNFDKIKDRLTNKSRDNIFSKIRDFNNLDFSVSNCYAMVIFAIENANKYFDQQIVETFDMLVSRDNIRNYKSNKKVWEEGYYRFSQQKPTHFTLEYRLVYQGYLSSYSWEEGKINDNQLLSNLQVIAYNLGFGKITNRQDLRAGREKQYLYLWNEEKQENEVFIEYKCFKNGNIHIRINQEFMKALNIEIARLKGWIYNKEDIINEFDCDISEEDCDKYFKKSFSIENNARFLIENF